MQSALGSLEIALTTGEADRVLAVEAAVAEAVGELSDAIREFRSQRTILPAAAGARTDALDHDQSAQLREAILAVRLATSRCEALGTAARDLVDRTFGADHESYGANGARRGTLRMTPTMHSRS